MKTANFAAATALALSVLGAAPALASDDVIPFQVATGLASADAREKLDGTVRFFFGDTAHGRVLHDYGEFTTNQKTNSFLKGDEGVCSHVFVSALIEFQKRAHELGANAVVDIHSYYRKEDVSSPDTVQCHVGGFVAGIALRGKFVQLPAH